MTADLSVLLDQLKARLSLGEMWLTESEFAALAEVAQAAEKAYEGFPEADALFYQHQRELAASLARLRRVLAGEEAKPLSLAARAAEAALKVATDALERMRVELVRVDGVAREKGERLQVATDALEEIDEHSGSLMNVKRIAREALAAIRQNT